MNSRYLFETFEPRTPLSTPSRNGQAGRGIKRREFDDDLPIAAPAENMLALNKAMEKLHAAAQKHFGLVILKVYAGLSLGDIAQQRGVSTRTLRTTT